MSQWHGHPYREGKLTDLERLALQAWRAWGSEWAMRTACASCGEVKMCRGKRRARMVCLDCFDQGKT